MSIQIVVFNSKLQTSVGMIELSNEKYISFLDKKQNGPITMEELRKIPTNLESFFRLIPQTHLLQEIELFPQQQFYNRLTRARKPCKISFFDSNYKQFKYYYSPARSGCPTFE